MRRQEPPLNFSRTIMTSARILLDCDPGYDDAAAILLAAGTPGVELLGITTVAGNQTIEKVTKNALRIARLVKLDKVPVARGSDRPLVREKIVPAADIHGESGLDGVELPPLPENWESLLDRRTAVELIIDTLMTEPAGTVTLVPTGPLTNIALAALTEPRIVERAKEVVLMGGGLHTGNVGPMSEFNIENDPEAAAVVFGLPWRVTMVGLDLTYQARATLEVRERIARIGTPAAALLSQILEECAIPYKKSRGFDAPPLHDPCALACVIDPGVMKVVQVPIRVETKGELTTGMTVADFRRAPAPDCHTWAATELDQARFWNLMAEAAARIPA